jgi:hypothetical protein
MNAFAAFVMRGPAHAGAVATAGLLAGLVVPPFAWLSSVVLALVALRLGAAALLRVALPSLAAVALAGWIVWDRPGALFLAGLAAWVPVVIVALVLRWRVRLDDALLAACALGWVVVLAVRLAVADPVAAWHGLLLEAFPPERLAADMQVSAEALRQVIERMAPLMTGVLAASVVFGTITGLLLARWWQAVLYNPGGFQREFHALRLGRVAAAVTAVVCAGAIASGVALLEALALTLVALYVFQGLAVVHGVVAARGMATGWLTGLYLLGIILPPQVMTGLTLVGIVDAWADFRRGAAAQS